MRTGVRLLQRLGTPCELLRCAILAGAAGVDRVSRPGDDLAAPGVTAGSVADPPGQDAAAVVARAGRAILPRVRG